MLRICSCYPDPKEKIHSSQGARKLGNQDGCEKAALFFMQQWSLQPLWNSSCESSQRSSQRGAWLTAGSPKVAVRCSISARGFLLHPHPILVNSSTHGNLTFRRKQPMEHPLAGAVSSHSPFCPACPALPGQHGPLVHTCTNITLTNPCWARPLSLLTFPCRGLNWCIGNTRLLVNKSQALAQGAQAAEISCKLRFSHLTNEETEVQGKHMVQCYKDNKQ